MNKKVAVLLSGCGVFDGTEAHEAILCFLALAEHNIDYTCYAPNRLAPATNHLDQTPEQYPRNIMQEAARLNRGQVHDLASLDAAQYDGLVVPGGFGVAKNLSNLATEQAQFVIDPSVKKSLLQFKSLEKHVAYLCIAPVLLPQIYEGITCTVGHDEGMSAIIDALGGQAIRKEVDAFHYDAAHRVFSTPAYMLADNILQVHQGVQATIGAFAQKL